MCSVLIYISLLRFQGKSLVPLDTVILRASQSACGKLFGGEKRVVGNLENVKSSHIYIFMSTPKGSEICIESNFIQHQYFSVVSHGCVFISS